MWRALGGPVELELEGIVRIFNVDRTAVFLAARSAEEFVASTLPGAHNVPVDKLATSGLENAPLPKDDFNTRVVLFGRDAAQARKLADAVGKMPCQNVSDFPGTFDDLAAAVRAKQ
jgi:rhodanese-related sulfurtransferase